MKQLLRTISTQLDDVNEKLDEILEFQNELKAEKVNKCIAPPMPLKSVQPIRETYDE